MSNVPDFVLKMPKQESLVTKPVLSKTSSIDSTNVLVAYLKPRYWALWPRW